MANPLSRAQKRLALFLHWNEGTSIAQIAQSSKRPASEIEDELQEAADIMHRWFHCAKNLLSPEQRMVLGQRLRHLEEGDLGKRRKAS